jgi:hypothetical protein
MWKDGANPWGAKKSESTGGVKKDGALSTGGKTAKNCPHPVFHISTKPGGNVDFTL